MRERSLDEFESIFEQASIPVLDIERIALYRVSAVLRNDPLDASILRLAKYFKRRFGSEIRLHWPAGTDSDVVQQTGREHGFAASADPFAHTLELVRQIGIGRSQLVLLPEPESEGARFIDLDALVQDTAPPILVVRSALDRPSAVFGRVLHCLTGNFQQTENFAYSFTLVESRGRLRLLHVIGANEVEDVRATLQVSPDIATRTGKTLLDNLARHGERYLKAVAATRRDRPFDVTYRLATGDIITTVRQELSTGDHGLLVVGSHDDGQSQVTADDYQLMHQVRDIPVLAL